ncbi:MAG: M13 family metallopeptidase [Myxococcota bacterium]
MVYLTSFRPLALLMPGLLLPTACALFPRAPNPPPADETTAPTFGLTLDETSLPPPVRLQPNDLEPEVSPCVDLNAHANARWLRDNPIPDDRTTWGPFEVLDERSKAIQLQLARQAAARTDARGVLKIVGDFWSTGINQTRANELGVSPLASRLAAIDAISSRAALAEHLRQTAARGESIVFDFSPEPDFKDSSVYLAYATQSGLGLPDKTYYFDEDKKEKRDAYLDHIAQILVLSGTAVDEAAALAKTVLDFETRLAQASRSREELSRDVSLWYHPVTVQEADALVPNFPWSTFFTSQGVPVPERFSLSMPEFHAEVGRMMEEVPLTHWQNYLRFHTLDSAAPYLSDEFVQEHFRFYRQVLRGQREMESREKRVLATINQNAGEALGQLYVEVAFSSAAKARMKALVQQLSSALKSRLEQLPWMGDETRRKALEKWATFTPKIGYPDKWRAWEGLETTRDSYLGNVLAARHFNYRWSMSKIGKPVDRTEWGMSPQTVNAYYNPLQNEIVFPAAILQPPFFDLEAEDAINYGGIGAVIGHEMLHGYDDQGSRFGPSGNFELWWQPEDSQRFADRTSRLVEQFDAYEVVGAGRVNGKLTLGENIADLGGLSVAYDAFLAAEGAASKGDALQQRRRFFLNWATVWRRSFTPEEMKVRLATDSHAPAHLRAVGAPSNLTAFAEAFECAPESPMVRGNDLQIVIW